MMSASPLVLLADDHAMVRDGLRSLIEVDWPEARFIEARDHDGVLAALTQSPSPDLAVIDVRMPGMRGGVSFAEFRAKNMNTPIIVVTGLDDPGLAPKLTALGATAVVSKEVPGDTLLQVVRDALDAKATANATNTQLAAATSAHNKGSHSISERQRDMLRLLHEGLPNKLIAKRLGIAETTVKGHLHALYAALDVGGRSEAIVRTRDWML